MPRFIKKRGWRLSLAMHSSVIAELESLRVGEGELESLQLSKKERNHATNQSQANPC